MIASSFIQQHAILILFIWSYFYLNIGNICALLVEPCYFGRYLLCLQIYCKYRVNPSPGQLRPQLCDLQTELQVHILTMSHRSQQAAVLVAQFAVSVLQFSHGAQQVFSITEAKQTAVKYNNTLITGGKHMLWSKEWKNKPGTLVAFWGGSFALGGGEIQPWEQTGFSELLLISFQTFLRMLDKTATSYRLQEPWRSLAKRHDCPPHQCWVTEKRV